jgi:hypothetical protein
MRRLLFLCLVTAACAGPGLSDVQVQWTFGGQTCDQAGVANIDIEVAGQNIFPHAFTCAQAGQGVDLGGFSQGTYEVTILGTDANGTAIYSGDFVIEVLAGGSQVYPLDSIGIFGDVDFIWTFDGGSCAGVGVSAVAVHIDGVAVATIDGTSELPCSTGGVDGFILPVIVGTHAIALDAVDSSGNTYSSSISVTVTNGVTTQEAVDLVH